jgi:putative MATE family efflux protein
LEEEKDEKPKTLLAQVIELAWPAVLQGLLSTIIIFTDRVILGHHSDDALASMQVSAPVLWSIFSLFGAYGIGVLAVIGRATGKKDTVMANHALGTALVIAVVLGGCIGLVGYLGTEAIAAAIIGDQSLGDAKQMAITYLQTVFLSGPILMIGSVSFIAFQASGDTKTPMWITGIGGLVNLVLSWVLIFGHFGLPELGILGAAIGTVVSSVSTALLGLGCMFIPKSVLRPTLPKWESLSMIMRVAWPAFGEKLLFHIGFLIFAGYVGHLGEEAMTAHQALMAIESLGYIVASAFGIAAGALVAQKLGAEKPQEAHKVGILSAKLGSGVLCGIGLFFWLFAEQLLGLFTESPDIVKIGIPCMMVAAFAQPLMALTDVFAGVLRGAGDTRNPMKVALFGPLLVRLSSCWLFAYYLDFGLLGIWFGSTLDWLSRTVWLWIIFRKGKWKFIQIEKGST